MKYKLILTAIFIVLASLIILYFVNKAENYVHHNEKVIEKTSLNKSGNKSVAEEGKKYSVQPCSNDFRKVEDLQTVLNIFKKSDVSLKAINCPYKFLIKFLKIHPEHSEELVARLDSYSTEFKSNKKILLWQSLAYAGTEKNQKVLLKAARSGKYKSTRIQAIEAMNLIAEPIPDIISGLWSIANQQGEDISKIAIMELGRIGGGSNYKSNFNPENIIREFEKRLGSSSDPKIIISYISGVANTKKPQALSIIIPYLSSKDMDIKSAAYKALASIGSSESLAVFFKSYEQEKNRFLKAAIISNFNNQKMNAQVNDWVKKQLMIELSQKKISLPVSNALIEIVGKSIKIFPDNENFLREISEQPLNPRVLSVISEYISR